MTHHDSGGQSQPGLLDWLGAILVGIGLTVVLALVCCGCALDADAADRLRDRTGAADGVMRVWQAQTPEWQHKAAHKMRRGYHAMRWELLDEPPEDPAIRAELEKLAKKKEEQ